ncbi:MAG: AP2 domain-containing protein [Eubacteriales bacterium]|nr:AP2 domain-containing protein [Eubacteriales bacterium]
MGRCIDLTGERFGRLTVLSKYGTTKDRQIVWLCKCDCGREIIVKSGNLKSGHTRSCGCFMKDRISETQAIHRQSHKRLYNVWTSMKARCYNPNSQFYKHYGGRGIVICEEWKENYQAFHDWAMKSGYDSEAPFGKCTIDRIDVDGPYAPWNCRWVDMKVQRHNRRKRVN